MGKCHITSVTSHMKKIEVIVSHHMVSHDKSHERCGKIVHRLCSSYISSVENPTRISQMVTYYL